MNILKYLHDSKNTLSFEVFPPKNNTNFDSVKKATEDIAKLKPSFVSITYGAGGGTSKYTLDICRNIQDSFDIDTVAHLTCISSSKETIHSQLDAISAAGISNVLALRGDMTPDLIAKKDVIRDYNYAIDLIEDIKRFYPNLCVGGACYPEIHPESKGFRDDLIHLKDKVSMGCSFLTSQMFFDNNLFYNFVSNAISFNINVPILPGIMPITNTNQLDRINILSGSHIPKELMNLIDKYGSNPDDMCKAGIDYATMQIRDLYSNGINHVHIYTMNKPYVANQIKNNIVDLL